MKKRRFIRFHFGGYRCDLSPVYFVLVCVLAFIVYFAGEYFASFLTHSDGQTYAAAYELIENQSPTDAYRSFALTTGAAEPFSFLLFYIFSWFASIGVTNALLNTSLIFFLFLLLRNKAVNIWCWAPFVLTNFYILLLGFGILRLKIGVLLLVLSWLVQDQRMRWVLVLTAALSHFQMIIPLVILLAEALLARRRTMVLKYVAVLIVSLIFFQYDEIHEKVVYYASQDLAPPYKLIVLSFISFFLLDRFRMALIMIGIFLPISLLVGDGRLNIIYFILITHEYLTFSRRNVYRNMVLASVAAYLSIKGIYFSKSLLDGYEYF